MISDPNLCDYGYYGFADLDNATWTIKIWDPWFDQAPEDCGPEGAQYCHHDSYRRFIALKQQNPNFKPIISIGKHDMYIFFTFTSFNFPSNIGGWNAGSGSYSDMALDPQKRATFVQSIKEFLEMYPFDGVDLDWEYPGDREGSDPEHDKEDFSRLVEEMSAMLKPMGKLFSAALTPGKNFAVSENAWPLNF